LGRGWWRFGWRAGGAVLGGAGTGQRVGAGGGGGGRRGERERRRPWCRRAQHFWHSATGQMLGEWTYSLPRVWRGWGPANVAVSLQSRPLLRGKSAEAYPGAHCAALRDRARPAEARHEVVCWEHGAAHVGDSACAPEEGMMGLRRRGHYGIRGVSAAWIRSGIVLPFVARSSGLGRACRHTRFPRMETSSSCQDLDCNGVFVLYAFLYSRSSAVNVRSPRLGALSRPTFCLVAVLLGEDRGGIDKRNQDDIGFVM